MVSQGLQNSKTFFRKKLDEISRQGFRSKSEVDLSAVPGSCSNIKTFFESNNNNDDDGDDRRNVSNVDQDELQVKEIGKMNGRSAAWLIKLQLVGLWLF